MATEADDVTQEQVDNGMDQETELGEIKQGVDDVKYTGKPAAGQPTDERQEQEQQQQRSSPVDRRNKTGRDRHRRKHPFRRYRGQDPVPPRSENVYYQDRRDSYRSRESYEQDYRPRESYGRRREGFSGPRHRPRDDYEPRRYHREEWSTHRRDKRDRHEPPKTRPNIVRRSPTPERKRRSADRTNDRVLKLTPGLNSMSDDVEEEEPQETPRRTFVTREEVEPETPSAPWEGITPGNMSERINDMTPDQLLDLAKAMSSQIAKSVETSFQEKSRKEQREKEAFLKQKRIASKALAGCEYRLSNLKQEASMHAAIQSSTLIALLGPKMLDTIQQNAKEVLDNGL